MKNAFELVKTLKDEYNCRLTDEQMYDFINSLEKRLCVEILKSTDFLTLFLSGEAKVDLDFNPMDIVSVHLDGKSICKTTAIKKGYRTDLKSIYIDVENANGELVIEHFAFPEEYSEENSNLRNLLLSKGHEDVYIYHILSREALMENDVSRLNNYSLLYTQALSSLKQEMQDKNTCAQNDFSSDKKIRFNKVW